MEEKEFIKIKQEDINSLILQLAQKENSPAKIGLILRDYHGIPKTKSFKKLTRILKENKIPLNFNQASINQKIQALNKHLAINKQDNSAKRALTKQLLALRSLEMQ